MIADERSGALEMSMKSCPYCAEQIRVEAIKCRHCGSLVQGRTPLTRPWYRDTRHKMIAGVCAGLALEFGISVTIVRLAFVLGSLIGGGMGVIIYVVLWVVMPRLYDTDSPGGDTPVPRD